MDHTPGLQAATRRASRARLLRFIAVCDPTRRWWLGGVQVTGEDMPDESLRCAAFCLADHFWAVRRARRFWRNYPVSMAPKSTGHVFPALSGAALDAWLTDSRATAIAA